MFNFNRKRREILQDKLSQKQNNIIISLRKSLKNDMTSVYTKLDKILIVDDQKIIEVNYTKMSIRVINKNVGGSSIIDYFPTNVIHILFKEIKNFEASQFDKILEHVDMLDVEELKRMNN